MFSIVAGNGEILENFETYESAMNSIGRFKEDEPEIIARVSEWAYELVSHGVPLGAFANDGKATFAAECRFRKGDKDVQVYEVLGDRRNVIWEDGKSVFESEDDGIAGADYESNPANPESEMMY